MKKYLLIAFSALAFLAVAQQIDPVGTGPGPGLRYATDAYPGFDTETDVIGTSRKEPRWMSFYFGPKMESSAEQYAYCMSLESEGAWGKAARGYDALVRAWPTSKEAPDAQRRLAEIRLDPEDDLEESLAEYKYLLDFYSSRCDYGLIADRLYALAGRMRQEGKTIVFFRFKNTVEVRRAFEACVLRAPGATWAPEAMLMIGELREEEGKDAKAVEVYENLRNLHYGTPEAKEAAWRESRVRLRLLRDHGYNRARCRDTISFLTLASELVAPEHLGELQEMLVEAHELLEAEAYHSACFYDSRMRTRRSAINAYERFLAEFPEGPHAEAVSRRVAELKGGAE